MISQQIQIQRNICCWIWGTQSQRSNLHIPLFTLNVSLLNVICIYRIAFPWGNHPERDDPPCSVYCAVASSLHFGSRSQDRDLGSVRRLGKEKWALQRLKAPTQAAGGEGSPLPLLACPLLPSILIPRSPGPLIDSSLGQISFCVLCIWIILPSWIPPMRSRKRQVLSPTMAPVPAKPFIFSQVLRSQYLLLLLLQLGLLTDTVNVPIFSCHWLTSTIDFQGLSPSLPLLFAHISPLLTTVFILQAASVMH